MKTWKQYIYEGDDKPKQKDDKDDKNQITPNITRSDVQFTIWEEPEKKVTKLKNNNAYQKIEYKLIDKDEHLSIDFLLGFQDNMWKMWIGKIGSCSYDDDFYCKFETDNFDVAVSEAIEKIIEFVEKVQDDPNNYIQYYTNL